MLAVNRRSLVLGGMAAIAVMLLLLLGWESDWGRSLQGHPIALSSPEPQPVALALLQDFTPPGGAAAYGEVTTRPLLTPTRQPAPPAPPPEARPSMPRGQFVLMGTLLAGGKNFALLREANGTKQTRVAQGDTIKNLTVDKVEPTQIVLRLGEETEVLPLKTHIPPRAAANAGPGGRPGAPRAPVLPPMAAPGGAAAHAPAGSLPTPGAEPARFRAAAPQGPAGSAASERGAGVIEGRKRTPQ